VNGKSIAFLENTRAACRSQATGTTASQATIDAGFRYRLRVSKIEQLEDFSDATLKPEGI